MGLREQSFFGCSPEFVFQFSVAQVLVGLQKQYINNFVFPTCSCAAGFNNNNYYYYFSFSLSFRMFHSDGSYADVIFQDSTQQLIPLPVEEQNYHAYLGKNLL